MTRKRANRFVGKLVKIKFHDSWFNEATQSWVDEDREYEGYLEKSRGEGQSNYYILEEKDGKFLETDNACWAAYRMKTIKEVKQGFYEN